jgi:hypothetical protein
MHKVATSALLAAGTLMLLGTGATPAGAVELAELLTGGNENPPVVTNATGRFRAVVRQGGVDFTLRYNVQGATAAHIHIANPGNNGDIAVFLCDPCPDGPQVVEDRFVAADVQEVLDGTTVVLEEGDLRGLIRLIRQGATYVNVHSGDHPAGEIRGQINPRRR